MKKRKAFHNKRLLKLADFLDKLPKKLFDLASIATIHDVETCHLDNTEKLQWWETHTDPYKVVKKLEALTAKKLDCKTTACALGWCPNVFPKLVKWDATRVDCDGDVPIVMIENDNSEGLDTAYDLFGLNETETDYLFIPSSYPNGRRGPKAVASRIRRFVEWGVPKKFMKENAYAY